MIPGNCTAHCYTIKAVMYALFWYQYRTLVNTEIMHKIRQNSKNQFRTKLYAENVEPSLDQSTQYVKEDLGEGAFVLVFKVLPLKLPPVDMYWKLGIKSTNEPVLTKVVLMLGYLNPGIDRFGIQLMAEYIIRRHVKLVKVNNSWVSSISNEELVKFIVSLQHVECPIEYLVQDTVALFSYTSTLTKDQKATITREIRKGRNDLLYTAIIHNVANTLIESVDTVKVITHSEIHSEVSREKEYGRRYYNKVVSKETKELVAFSKA